MTALKKIIASLVIMAACFAGGYLTHQRTGTPEIKITYREKLVWREGTVHRDYTALPEQECVAALRCYDTAQPSLDAAPLRDNTFRLSASLCERSWSRDIKLSAGSSGNWTFYVGAGVVAGAGAVFLLMR
jgi:hypothetical protein